MKDVTVVVLAAGKGTRLGEWGRRSAKALIPLADKPILFWNLELIARAGAKRVFINLHHLGDQIRAAAGDGKKFGLEIEYFPEESLLGTAGALVPMRERISDTFAMLFADNLIETDLAALVEGHRQSGAALTVTTYEPEEPWTMGVVVRRADGSLQAVIEKPPRESCPSREVLASVFVARRSAIDSIAPPPTAIAPDWIDALLGKGLRIEAIPFHGYIQDVGTPERWAKADADARAGHFLHTSSRGP